MLARLYSFKFIISFALLWLGALAYGLAIYSTHVYRNHAVESQIESLQSLLRHESDEAIQELYDNQKLFALKLQSEAPFQDALKNRDAAGMEAWLGESYSRYQIASGLFRLKAIIVRDLSGGIFAQSSDGGLDSYTGCPTVLKSIGGLLIRRLKPSYSLCSFDGQLYSEVLIPIGTFECTVCAWRRSL